MRDARALVSLARRDVRRPAVFHLKDVMLKGTRDALVKKIQPVSIHGQISLDVYVVDPDDPQGQVSLARLGPEAIPKSLEAGDRVTLHYMLGVVTSITKS